MFCTKHFRRLWFSAWKCLLFIPLLRIFYPAKRTRALLTKTGKHFATCTVALSGLTLFSDMYGSSWYLWIVCTSFATCTVPAKYALPFFGTCTVETPARKFLDPSYFVTALVVMLLHTSVLDSYLAPLFELFKLGADKNQKKHGGKPSTFHEI